MWIKTQEGELVNFDHLLSISVVEDRFRTLVMGVWKSSGRGTLGAFRTSAEADAYFDQLAKLLTKETDHD